ncbi:hypothetical protein Ddc_00093 [Ditylenchus destructor]|nr:hypothetical protein Ddc_00093 [Ditylenchus destructor]
MYGPRRNSNGRIRERMETQSWTPWNQRTSCLERVQATQSVGNQNHFRYSETEVYSHQVDAVLGLMTPMNARSFIDFDNLLPIGEKLQDDDTIAIVSGSIENDETLEDEEDD